MGGDSHGMYPVKSLSSCSRVIQGCFIIIKSSLLWAWKSKNGKKHETSADVQVWMTDCREMSCSGCCTLRKMLLIPLIKKICDASYTPTKFLFIFFCLLPDLEGKLCSSYCGFFLPELFCVSYQNYLLLEERTLRKPCGLNIQHMWSSRLKNVKCQWYL